MGARLLLAGLLGLALVLLTVADEEDNQVVIQDEAGQALSGHHIKALERHQRSADPGRRVKKKKARKSSKRMVNKKGKRNNRNSKGKKVSGMKKKTKKGENNKDRKSKRSKKVKKDKKLQKKLKIGRKIQKRS